jgi:hypothetical protein
MLEAQKAGCMSLSFLRSLMLSVPCVALVRHRLIVATNAD